MAKAIRCTIFEEKIFPLDEGQQARLNKDGKLWATLPDTEAAFNWQSNIAEGLHDGGVECELIEVDEDDLIGEDDWEILDKLEVYETGKPVA